MRILIVRHAIAVDRAEPAHADQPDEARPLTPKGRRRMRRAARGLHRLLPDLDVLATSPLVRARQTAELLGRAYGLHDAPATVAALVPDTPLAEVRDWLNAQDGGATIALVGHEPQLSRLIAWLIADREQPFTELTRGGACLLECDAPIVEGTARMAWLLRAGQLRRLR